MKKRKNKYGSYSIKHLGIWFLIALLAAIAWMEYDYEDYFLSAKRRIQEDFNEAAGEIEWLLENNRFEDVEGNVLMILNRLQCGSSTDIYHETLGSGNAEYVHGIGWDGKSKSFGGNFIPWNAIMDAETGEILTQNKDVDHLSFIYLIPVRRDEDSIAKWIRDIQYYYCDGKELSGYLGGVLSQKREEWIKKLENEDSGYRKDFRWQLDSFYHVGSKFLPAHLTLKYYAYDEPNKLVSVMISERVLEEVEFVPDGINDYELRQVDLENEYCNNPFSRGEVHNPESSQYANVDESFVQRAMKRSGELDRSYLRTEYEGAWQEKKFLLKFTPGDMAFAMEREVTDAAGRKLKLYSYQEIKNTYHLNVDVNVMHWVLLAFGALFGALLFSYLEYLKKRYQDVTQGYREMLMDSMAHDLKTPLTAIGGYAENLKEHVNDEKRDHYAEEIQSSVSYVNEIITKNLELLKFDREHRKIKKTKLDVRDLFEEALKREQGEIERKKLQVTIDGEMVVKGDRSLLEKVADNLVSNCVKYSKDGGKVIIKFQKRKFTIQNETMISYDGEKELKNLWEPFVRGQDSRTGSGTGLGLAIVANVLDRHRLKYRLKYDKETKVFTCEVINPVITIA